MLGVSLSLTAAAGMHSPRSGGRRRDTERVMASRVTSTRFVGRATELEELRSAVAEAAGGRPSLAFVAGESGVGKTRLLGELERAARADGVRVIGGDCVELGESELPYAPIVGALRPLARTGDAAFAALSDGARGALAQILPGLGTSERGRRTSRPRRRACSTPCWSCSSCSRARPACWSRSRTSTGPTARRAPSSCTWRARCAASACWSSPPTARTSCTGAIRCGRCWPSSSATPARAASSSSR